MCMNINGVAGNLNRESLAEIARAAYGHRLTEGTSGGNGNIGILVTRDGTTRVVKFNTHRSERKVDGNPTVTQIGTANNLRSQLLQIARSYGVDEAKMGQIREKLGLPAQGDEETARSLLTRTVVAKVVKMIDGDIWAHALKNVDMKNYSSANVCTTFSAAVGTVRDPGGKRIRDTVFLKTLTDATNDELRAFGQYMDDNGLHIDPKLGTTIRNAVVKAVRHRMTQAPGGADTNQCRNLVRNVVVLALLAWGREDEALQYINDHVAIEDRRDELDKTAFADSATAMHALLYSIQNAPASQQRTALDLAVERLVCDRDGVVTNRFGNTVGRFATPVAVGAGADSKRAFRGKDLTDQQRDYADHYAAIEKDQPVPQPVSTDAQTQADVKNVKDVIGKGPKTVAFTPEHTADTRHQIEETANEAINDPHSLDVNLELIARDMQGKYQMIYDGQLSIHPSHNGEQNEKDAIRADLETVFTREDGTVDTPALTAFCSFANQKLNAMVHVSHAHEHPGKNEFPATALDGVNGSAQVKGTTIRLDYGSEPGSYRVTYSEVTKGRLAFVASGDNLTELDPNDPENFVRYDCTFDFKMVDGRCVVSFPEIPTVSLNLNAPAA